jgi:PleD family two-component response regulator
MEPSKPLGESALASRPSVPVVFVVDDDISVREALESVIHHEGWQVATFATAQDFLAIRACVRRAVSCSTYICRTSAVSICRTASRRIE